jgi:predicted ester cyclase
MTNSIEENKKIATRYIEAFNNDDWDTVREVVSPNFTFHHPIGGTVQAGPEGMVGVWADFKASLPDSWHPIPIMIADGDYLAVLLPTYGHFSGKPYHGVQPTGKWLEYGMVNIVRFENGKIAENWFGMDPLAEQQQMGTAPLFPPRQLNTNEKENLEIFQNTINKTNNEYDNLTPFNDTILALGPPQDKIETCSRKIEIFKNINGSLRLMYYNEFVTNPPYNRKTSVDSEFSRNHINRFIKEVLIQHDLDVIDDIVSSNIIIHPTAMPCEASYFGNIGICNWLNSQWKSFPDLTITDFFTISQGDIVAVHWSAQGTSEGEFYKLPPTGNKIQFTGNSMCRVEDGKIAEIWDARNTLGIMLQLNPDIGKGNHSH